MDEMTLTLNNPLTEEEWDLIEDVDFDKTNSIEFHTKHGKTVKFVKSTDERTGDTISRQAAIDALGEEPLVWNDNDYDLGTRNQWEYDVECLKEVPPAQPEQRWIPVTERLPEEKDAGILKKLGTSKRSDYVLATVEVKNERMTVTACTYDGAWDWNMKYAFPDYKVVAWMPLPEPYRGGEQDD